MDAQIDSNKIGEAQTPLPVGDTANNGHQSNESTPKKPLK